MEYIQLFFVIRQLLSGIVVPQFTSIKNWKECISRYLHVGMDIGK